MSYFALHGFGNLTRDPELKNAGTDKAVCNFAIAANRKVGGEDKATFLECKAFGTTAENIAKFFAKGARLIIRDGELEEQRWEDKNTGEKRSRIVCVVNRFDFPERAAARDDAGHDDHGERSARDNFRDEAPAPRRQAAPAPRNDRDQREQRSAAKQQELPGQGRPLDTYGEEDVPF